VWEVWGVWGVWGVWEENNDRAYFPLPFTFYP
jgi:hypothetical protein